jgi:hypothetical protein
MYMPCQYNNSFRLLAAGIKQVLSTPDKCPLPSNYAKAQKLYLAHKHTIESTLLLAAGIKQVTFVPPRHARPITNHAK